MDLGVDKYSAYQASTKAAQQKREKQKQEKQTLKISRQKQERSLLLQKEQERQKLSKLQTEQYLKEILRITSIFDRELRFSVNKELDQVVVKVIDSYTDKVIKEIPPEDIIKLHTRMKEVIGLLFDKKI